MMKIIIRLITVVMITEIMRSVMKAITRSKISKKAITWTMRKQVTLMRDLTCAMHGSIII